MTESIKETYKAYARTKNMKNKPVSALFYIILKGRRDDCEQQLEILKYYSSLNSYTRQTILSFESMLFDYNNILNCWVCLHNE